MLVLGVKEGDYVMIGDDVMMRVMQVDNQFRLAFDAPREVIIKRAEVYEKELAEKAKGETRGKPQRASSEKPEARNAKSKE